MKKVMVISIIILLGLAWRTTMEVLIQRPEEYRTYLQKAADFESQEVYYDAILMLQEALQYEPKSREICLRIANNYLALGEEEYFEEYCNKAIGLSEENEEAVFLLVDYYIEQENREDAIALLKREISRKDGNQALQSKLESLAGAYRNLGSSYEEIWSVGDGFMKVKQNGSYGILDSSGNERIRPQYQAAGAFGSNGFAPVKNDKEWFLVDENNYKRRAGKEKYDVIGICSEGVHPAKKGDVWGYLDQDLNECTEFIYEDATPLLEGVGAVKKNGKWALIGKDLELLTEFGFEGVAQDEYGFCSRNGVVFVKTGGNYQLVGKNGVSVGEGRFEDVSPFLSEQPAAVMEAGKWGFLSKEGELTMEYQFQEAKSFSSIGYAPVRKEDAWGYVKTSGDLVIPYEFEDAKAFNGNGIAPVKQNGVWQLIQLDIY